MHIPSLPFNKHATYGTTVKKIAFGDSFSRQAI